MTNKNQDENKIIQLVMADPLRVRALDIVFSMGLPDCYIAAGFVRNLVWDDLHNKSSLTPLNDVDVIYFDPAEKLIDKHTEYEAQLNSLMPDLNWQVRNQAKMHIRNNDNPYQNTLDAMAHWPEKETAVAIRKYGEDLYECISSFGFDSLFDLKVTYNPKRRLDVFHKRVHSKNWMKIWPDLKIQL